MSLLRQLAQRFPYNKALSFYVSALCHFELHSYSQALIVCKVALEASPNEELLQKIYNLKAEIESVQASFGFGFWIQWLITTIAVGAITLFGAIDFLGVDSSTSGLLGGLSMGITIGFVQWLLIRLRTNAGILSLLVNMVIVLVILTLSMMLSTINIWLGLLTFLGCNMISTTWSIGRLVKQPT